ncbi:MAG: hypothetical protein M3Q81_01625 [bacterium]|nr:hypothetical protein [bacterium]
MTENLIQFNQGHTRLLRAAGILAETESSVTAYELAKNAVAVGEISKALDYLSQESGNLAMSIMNISEVIHTLQHMLENALSSSTLTAASELRSHYSTFKELILRGEHETGLYLECLAYLKNSIVTAYSSTAGTSEAVATDSVHHEIDKLRHFIRKIERDNRVIQNRLDQHRSQLQDVSQKIELYLNSDHST